MVRFLHTADWQLGKRPHFLDEEAQPRYVQARIDAIRALADVAREEQCEFVVVCGDVFESNQVDRRTLVRALEALESFPCPVYLLPGNHDPLDAASVYRSKEFLQRKPAHVHVLTTNEPVAVRDGVEVVGAPWTTKRPRHDLVAETCAALEPTRDRVRVCVAHGPVDTPDRKNPARIDRGSAERALEDGRIHFLALGDRHSTTEVGQRIWYSGTPEATDYGEIEPDQALVVELDADRCAVRKCRVGRWSFQPVRAELDSVEDVAALAERLEALPAKESTALRLELEGALTLRAKARLDALRDHAGDLFASVEWRETGLAILPDDLDLGELGLAGFAKATAQELTALAETDPEARDALALLYRLAGGGAA